MIDINQEITKNKESIENHDKYHDHYCDCAEFARGKLEGLILGKQYINQEIQAIVKRIKEDWDKITFDLHTRFCRIDDVGGVSQNGCRRYKEAVLDEVIARIQSQQDKTIGALGSIPNVSEKAYSSVDKTADVNSEKDKLIEEIKSLACFGVGCSPYPHNAINCPKGLIKAENLIKIINQLKEKK